VIDYLKALHEVDSNGLARVTSKVPDEDVGVQLRKTCDCSVCSRLSDIIFTKEELKGPCA
jgi:hypothetical protein